MSLFFFIIIKEMRSDTLELENVAEEIRSISFVDEDPKGQDNSCRALESGNTSKKSDAHPLDSWDTVKTLLPPVRKPKKARKQQTLLGVSVVIFVICFLVTISSCAVFFGDFGSLATKWILAGIVYGLAFLALGCVVAILTIDPGTIHRSERTCMPLPDKVKERILSNIDEGKEPSVESFVGLNNFTHEGTIYCIRCCVWRRIGEDVAIYKKRKTFHCNMCECCVQQMDHHCGVFGRCIAGNGIILTIKEARFQGNMFYFQTLIVLGCLGGFMATVLSAVSLSISVVWWAGVVVCGCVCAYACCCGCAIFSRISGCGVRRRYNRR